MLAGVSSIALLAGGALAGVAGAAVVLTAASGALAAGLAGGVVGGLTLVAATAEDVRTKFKDLGSTMLSSMRDATRPISDVLLTGADNIDRAFVGLIPTIERLSDKVAPLLDSIFGSMEKNAPEFGLMLERMFDNSLPSLRAFIDLGGNLLGFLDGFLDKIGKGGERVPDFIRAFGRFFETLGPLLGALATAAAEFATVVLETLTPQIEKLTKKVETGLQPALDELGDWFSDNIGLIGKAAVTFGALFIAIRTISAISTLVSGLTLLLNPIGLVVLAVAGLATGFAYLWTTSEEFRDRVTRAWEDVQEGVSDVVDWFEEHVGPVLQPIIEGIAASSDDLKGNWEGFQEAISEVDASGLVTALEDLADALQPFADGLGNLIEEYLPQAGDLFEGLGEIVAGTAQSTNDDFTYIIEGLTNLLNETKRILAYVGVEFITLEATINVAWTTIKTETENNWNGILLFLSYIPNKIAAIFSTLGMTLAVLFRNAFERAKRAVIEKAVEIVAYVRGIPGRLADAITSNSLYQAGRDLISGFARGISSMARSAVDAASNVASGAVRSVKRVLGIQSPSRVFMDIGEQVNRGLVIGLSRIQGVQRAARGLSDAVADNFAAPRLAGPVTPGGAVAAGAGGGQFIVNVQSFETTDDIERRMFEAYENFKRKNGLR